MKLGGAVLGAVGAIDGHNVTVEVVGLAVGDFLEGVTEGLLLGLGVGYRVGTSDGCDVGLFEKYVILQLIRRNGVPIVKSSLTSRYFCWPVE